MDAVKRAFYSADGRIAHMGVNFCGFGAFVSQQLLNETQVSAGFQQVGGVGVPEPVQGGGFPDAGLLKRLFQYHLYAAFPVFLAGGLSFEQPHLWPKSPVVYPE